MNQFCRVKESLLWDPRELTQGWDSLLCLTLLSSLAWGQSLLILSGGRNCTCGEEFGMLVELELRPSFSPFWCCCEISAVPAAPPVQLGERSPPFVASLLQKAAQIQLLGTIPRRCALSEGISWFIHIFLSMNLLLCAGKPLKAGVWSVLGGCRWEQSLTQSSWVSLKWESWERRRTNRDNFSFASE